MKKKISLLLLTGFCFSTFSSAYALQVPVPTVDAGGNVIVSGTTDLDPGRYSVTIKTDKDDSITLGTLFVDPGEDGGNSAILEVELGSKYANANASITLRDPTTGSLVTIPPDGGGVDPDPVEPTDRPTNPTTPSDDDDDDDDSSGGGGGGGSSSTTVKNPNPTKYVKRDEKQTPTQNTTPNTAWTSTGSGPMVFFDVQTTDWFYNAVNYVTQNGMMVGSNGKFNPNDRLTRGMMAQILYNIEKTPAAGTASFPDVQSTDWFASACAWANASGYMTGYSNGNFGPNDPITREQLAAILYRYSGAKGYNTSATAELSGFADGSSTSAWAATSMRWAVTTGLLSGKTGNRLDPTGTATRAEVAQILMNFGTKIAQ